MTVKKQIKRFGILQTAKISAIIYFVMSSVILIPLGLAMLFGKESYVFGIYFLILPFIYGIVAFIMVALGCVLYNWVVTWAGGIAIDIETE